MMKIIGIYKITSPTNKIYIGQSWDIETRKSQYKNNYVNKQPLIFASIKKYGWNSHQFTVVEEFNPCTINQMLLDEREVFWIKHYESHNFIMLNLREGGSRGLHKEETKQKISKSLTGPNHPMFGKKQTIEFIKKRTSKNIGKKHTPETKRKQSISRLGISFTKEHILNLSQPIAQLAKDGSFIKKWLSINDASNSLKINNISAVCRGLRKTAGGYIWKYI